MTTPCTCRQYRQAVLLASIGLCAGGCFEETHCAFSGVELRAAEPGTVAFNEYSCQDSFSPCRSPTRARIDENAYCESLTVVAVGGDPWFGRELGMFFGFEGGQLRSVGAQIDHPSDEEPIPPEMVIRGWFVPDEVSTVRIAGRFSLQFAAGTVEGSIDTAHGMRSDYYVMSAIDVPDDPGQAPSLSLDIDQDPQARPNNRLGAFIASVPRWQEATDAALENGDLLHVVGLPIGYPIATTAVEWASFEADDADDPPVPGDNLSGAGKLVGKAGTATDGFVLGFLLQDHFRGRGGEFPIRLALSWGGTSVSLDLVAAGVEADLTEDGYEGRLGGVIPVDQITARLLPALAESFSATVSAECTPQCILGGPGENILRRFDTDGDRIVTLDELSSNAEVVAALSPDVAVVLNRYGRWSPSSSPMSNNALSVGFGFRTAPVEFTPRR